MRNFAAYELYGLNRSDEVWSGLCAADTDYTITPPAGARFAVFSCQANFLCNIGDNGLTVPSAGAPVKNGTIVNPTVRHFRATDLAAEGLTFDITVRVPDSPAFLSIEFYE